MTEQATSATPGEITQAQIDAAVADAQARHAARSDNPPAPAQTAKPEWVEDKFWNAEKGEVNTEALAQSYRELQTKLSSQPKPEVQAPSPNGQPTPEAAAQAAAEGDPAPIAEALKAAGIDFQAVQQEFDAGNGKITDATRDKLVQAFGAEVVDNYFEGLSARTQAAAADYANSIYEGVGGKEAYNAMSEWALDNVPEAELASYNAVVNGGNVDAAKLAAQAMLARFNANGGTEPNLVNGGKTSISATAPYQSMAEYTRDINDPRYRKDAAFRADVDRKAAASTTHLLGG